MGNRRYVAIAEIRQGVSIASLEQYTETIQEEKEMIQRGSFYENFLSHFKNGIMKPNRYEVAFQLPPGVNSSAGFVNAAARSGAVKSADLTMNGAQSINVKCHTAIFPQRTLATTERLQNSAPFRTPYSSNYDPVTFSFYADATGDTRRYFDLWQNVVINVRSNTMNFYEEFVSDINMWSLDEAGNRKYGIKLVEAYPLAVGALDVSFSNQNNFQNIVSTFNYRHWFEIRGPSVSVGGLQVL